MTERQFEGRSVAEAAIKACEVLGTTRQALRYKVLSETGENLARRVVIAVEVPEKPAAAAPRALEAATPAQAEQEAPPPRRSEADHERRERSPRRRTERHGEHSERAERGRDGRSGGSRTGRGRGPRSGRERERPSEDDGIEALLKLDGTAPPPQRPAMATPSPRAQKAATLVNDLVRHMSFGLHGQVVAEEENEIHIDLHGADETRAVGRKGEVLLALQFVVNRMLSRGEEESDQVVVLDVGGYRQRRRGALEDLARKLAGRAVQERKAVRLSPMSAHDRRVFHMTLRDMEGVITRSEGDGLYRNLLIIPSEFA